MHLMMMMDPAKNKGGGKGPRRGKEGHLCGEGPLDGKGPPAP